MGGARVQGIACQWRDLSNCSGGHVMVVLGGFDESSLGYLRWGGFSSSLYPFLHHVSLRSTPLRSVCCWWT